jgi:Flp pilus assembly protein TadG
MTGLANDRRGAAAVEFALVAPLLVAILVGLVELAAWSWGAAETRDLVARAARCVAVAPERCRGDAAVAALVAAESRFNNRV